MLKVLDGGGAHKVPPPSFLKLLAPGRTQGDAKSFFYFFSSIPTGEFTKPQWILSSPWSHATLVLLQVTKKTEEHQCKQCVGGLGEDDRGG